MLLFQYVEGGGLKQSQQKYIFCFNHDKNWVSESIPFDPFCVSLPLYVYSIRSIRGIVPQNPRKLAIPATVDA